MNKPRYWPVAFPLAITSLCVAPQAYFLKHWQVFFDSFVSKMKVFAIPSIVPTLNLMMSVGKAVQSDGAEWHFAPCLDLSISLPRICVDDYDETGRCPEALLPSK